MDCLHSCVTYGNKKNWQCLRSCFVVPRLVVFLGCLIIFQEYRIKINNSSLNLGITFYFLFFHHLPFILYRFVGFFFSVLFLSKQSTLLLQLVMYVELKKTAGISLGTYTKFLDSLTNSGQNYTVFAHLFYCQHLLEG